MSMPLPPAGWASAAAVPVDSSIISQIIQSAGAGTAIMLILLLLGIVQTKSYTQRVEKEADRWRAAYDAERTARAEVERALAAERHRADAAVEAAKVTTEVLEGLRGRINAPEAQRWPPRPAIAGDAGGSAGPQPGI